MARIHRWTGRRGLIVAAIVLIAGPGYGQPDDERMFFSRGTPGYSTFGVPSGTDGLPDWTSPDSPRLKVTVRPNARSGQSIRPGTLACVRTCDGYFFPVSGGITDPAIADFMCKASCPGAPTKLYSLRSDTIDDAVGVDRSPYKKLAAALSFRKDASPTCSCRRPDGAITAGPVFDDPTLKTGDIIVVKGRAVVFRGAARRPYTERDFTPIEHSSLPADSRQKIHALLSVGPVSTGLPKRTARSVQPKQKGTKAPAPVILTSDGRIRVVLPAPFEASGLPASIPAFAPVTR